MNRNIEISRILLADNELKSLREMKQRVIMENTAVRVVVKESDPNIELVGCDIVKEIDHMIDFRTKQILSHYETPGNKT